MTVMMMMMEYDDLAAQNQQRNGNASKSTNG
jgi:hypothetical protein